MANDLDRFKKGSLPPFIGLAEAITLVTAIHEQAGGRANYDLLSRIFDNSQSSSSFTKKLAVLKSYGLVNEPIKGAVELSDGGIAVAAPTSDDAFALAKRDAFLRIEVYGRIHARHKGKLLPADEFLRNIIEQDCGIPRELSSKWAKDFKENARTAGLLHDRGDGRLQLMDSPVVQKPVATSDSLRNENATTSPIPTSMPSERTVLPSTLVPVSASGLNYKRELSGGRLAILSIPDQLTEKDAQRLKEFFDGLGKLIDSLVREEN